MKVWMQRAEWAQWSLGATDSTLINENSLIEQRHKNNVLTPRSHATGTTPAVGRPEGHRSGQNDARWKKSCVYNHDV